MMLLYLFNMAKESMRGGAGCQGRDREGRVHAGQWGNGQHEGMVPSSWTEKVVRVIN